MSPKYLIDLIYRELIIVTADVPARALAQPWPSKKQDFKRMITASIWLINQKVKMIPVNDLTGKSDKSKPQV